MEQAIGFDNEKYLAEQTAAILERAKQNGNKLYLEFGGKLMQDMHAARVLPGYDPNVKMRLLQKLKDKAEILLCIYAGDIERKKMRADFGISYESDTMRLIDGFHSLGLLVRAVVIAVPFLFSDAFAYFGWFWLLFGFSLPMYAVVKLFHKQLHLDPKAEEDEIGQD